jgi:5-methylthioribose kinase
MADRLGQANQMELRVLWAVEMDRVSPDIHILAKDANMMPNMVHRMYELRYCDHHGSVLVSNERLLFLANSFIDGREDPNKYLHRLQTEKEHTA